MENNMLKTAQDYSQCSIIIDKISLKSGIQISSITCKCSNLK